MFLEYFRKKLSPWKSIDDHVPVASVLSIGYTVGVYEGENLADSQRLVWKNIITFDSGGVRTNFWVQNHVEIRELSIEHTFRWF